MKTPKHRVGLPTIDSFEKHIIMGVDSPGKVVIRLERLMGSNRVPLNDGKYIDKLIEKIEEEEQMSWEKRKLQREKAEKDRIRLLAINGLIEPNEDMKDLQTHPVFRVNKILNRLAKIDDSMKTTIPTHTKIKPTEPFHEQEFLENGILFGFHKNHYRKTQILDRKQSEKKKSMLSEMGQETMKEEEEYIETKLSDAEAERESSSKSPMSAEEDDEEEAEEVDEVDEVETEEIDESIDEEEWGGEDYVSAPKQSLNRTQIVSKSPKELGKMPFTEAFPPSTSSASGTAPPQKSEAQENLTELEKKWAGRKAPWIEKLFDPSHRDADSMYKYANELLSSYKREKLAADSLAGKYLRRLND